MKKYLILFFLVLSVGVSVGQSDIDTTEWANELKLMEDQMEKEHTKTKFQLLSEYTKDVAKYSKHLGLTTLQGKKEKFHIRIWTEKQCFEIKSNSQSKITGRLTNYAVTVESESIVTSNKLNVAMGQTIVLEKELAKRIYSSFEELRVDTISSMEKIPLWHHGDDGNTIIIEQLINGKYQFKFYWSPQSSDENILQAKALQAFEDNFYSDDLTLIHKQFFKTLPVGCYYYGGMTIFCISKEK